jgi:3-oxoacyl-[acyl-carrier-protein] synthase II
MTESAWITGIGMVSPLGIGWRENWDAMCAGKSGIHAISSFNTDGLATKIAGEVPGDIAQLFKQTCRLPFPNRYARFTQFGLLAGHMALEDAGLEIEREDPYRVGVSIGAGAGSFHYLLSIDQAFIYNSDKLEEMLDHNFVVKYMANAVTAQMSIWKGLRGPSTTVSVACATGAQSIAMAIDWIRLGRADVVLAGASDATVNRFALHAYNKAGALSIANDEPEKASRPFDRLRDGFIMAEGACVMVLESERHARARGAERYASLLGHAYNGEAHNIVIPQPEGEGIAHTINMALADAGINGDQLDYISAHGTGTKYNDVTETKGIKKALGDHAYKIPVSSQKSMMGHAIGATSAIEIGISALTIRHGVITPTINLEEHDAECDLDYVPHQSRKAKVDYVLSNAFGFGGHNCCIVLGR